MNDESNSIVAEMMEEESFKSMHSVVFIIAHKLW